MKRVITLLQVLFICIFVVCGAYIAKAFYDKVQTEKEMSQLREMVNTQDEREEQTMPTKAPEEEFYEIPSDTAVEETDNGEAFERYRQLYERNNDMRGWIKIDGTPIDYPVVQNSESNAYYLHRNFDKQKSSAGIPFMDYQCDYDSDNIIIYAHNMTNGTMFHHLLDFASYDFYGKHRDISFDTLQNRYIYRVVAVFRTSVGSKNEFKYYEYISPQTEEEFDEFISTCKALSLYDTGEDVIFGDKLLTLSTCSYNSRNERFVVVSKRIAQR